MRLRDIVPSVELCQKLPEGVFTDSAFYWCKPNTSEWCVIHNPGKEYIEHAGKNCCPAPTVEELLVKMDWRNANTFRVEKDIEEWFVSQMSTAQVGTVDVGAKSFTDAIANVYLIKHKGRSEGTD